MQILLDHIAATILGITVVFILLQLQLDSHEANADALRYHANRVQTLSFLETLERDFQNIGAGVNAGGVMIVGLTNDSPTSSFEFMAMTDTTAAATVQQIKYELVPTGTATIHSGSVSQSKPTYEIRRLVRTGSGYAVTGRSSNSILEFEVTLLSASGVAVGSDFESARVVGVSLVSLSPMGHDGVTGESRWKSSFRPSSLKLQ